MRIGYPCLNLTLKRSSNSTFRLKSYSENRLNETVKSNLEHLLNVLKFNFNNGILFFRISSGLIPFASHPICKSDWGNSFKSQLTETGEYIKKNNFRVSMHPSQFVILNSKHERIIENSIKELHYHCKLLDGMGLPHDAKIQIHVGGAFGDKKTAKDDFINTYNKLDEKLKNRMVIENDERSYSLGDCIDINKQTGVPIVLDTLHHEHLNNGENIEEAILLAAKTWKNPFDGVQIIDYSSQSKGDRKGKHAQTIDKNHFIKILHTIEKIMAKYSCDMDLMIEIKDKEKSALAALEWIRSLSRMSNYKSIKG